MAKLDAIDTQILRQLQANGRVPVQDLSEHVGLSPSPCSRRIKLLEQQGVIVGYAALIDEAKIGFDASVFVSVKLDKQIDNALTNFEVIVNSYPEVVDCWLMTGTRDYLMRVVTESLADFESFLTRIRTH